MKDQKVKSVIVDGLSFLLGGILYSVGVIMFLSPNKISPGGLTGIATFLNYLLGLPIGTTVFVLNIPLLIWGFIKFGGLFIIKTTVAITVSSLLLDISAVFLPHFQVEPILAAIFGGVLLGSGISVYMLRGATTGGVDIIAKIINRRFSHLTVGRIMLVNDAAIVLLAAVVYRNLESVLYSVTAIFSSSIIMDTLLYGADKGKIIFIITENAEIMCQKITTIVNRGITVIDVVGGYSGIKKKMLMCTVRRNEVSAVYRQARDCDDKSFIVVGEAGEIFGEGFKPIK